ncbi:MAG TPA: hypothetical protein EYO09_01760 [Candidatus Poseidoniales archaeon]|nr:hypothetical protein [Candidatus Poseidoniales archaeon]
MVNKGGHYRHTRVMVRQPRNIKEWISILTIGLLLVTMPSASGSSYLSSGLAISGFFNPSEIAGDSYAVSYSPDEELIAAGYDSGVVLYNSTTKEVIKSINMNDAVYHVEFSTDGQFLALGMRSLEAHQNALVLMSKDAGWSVIDDVTGSKRVLSVAISPNNSDIAFNGATTSIIEANLSDLDDYVTYDGIHSGAITCLSYSSEGSFLLSGGSDGRLVKWSRNNSSTQVIYNFESVGISDCSVSPSSDKFAVLSGGGIIQIYSEYEELEYSIDITQGSRILWSADGLRLYVIQTIGASKLLSYISASGAWSSGTITNLGHVVSDFDIKTDYSTLITATNTRHLTEYSDAYTPLYYGIPGLDSDGDGIPNDFDEDDDGDGIIDKWDSECPGGISCSLTPKHNSVRQLKIVISEDEVFAFDIILLTSEQSSAIRNITTISIEDDVFLSDQEAYRISDSICSNIVTRDLIDSWQAKLSIEGVSLSNGVVDCTATYGLLDTSANDYETRIRITTFTTFKMNGNPTIPYNISITGIIPMPSGSAAQIAPLFPILVQVDALGSDKYEVLWDTIGSGIVLPVNEAAAVELSVLEKMLNFTIDNILWVILAGIFSIFGIITIIRRRNLQILSLDMDDEEIDIGEGLDSAYEDTKWRADEGEAPPKPSLGPPPSLRQRVATSISPASVSSIKSKNVRRKPGSLEIPEDSKRIRLDSHSIQSNPPSEWDYGWDATYEDTSEAHDYREEISLPKVRKVKMAEEESQPKKRRKAKRRSKKASVKEKVSEKETISTSSQDDDEIMDSALDKLVFSDKGD